MNFNNLNDEDLEPMKKSLVGSIIGGVKNMFSNPKYDTEEPNKRQFGTSFKGQYMRQVIPNSLYQVMDNYLRYNI